MNVFPAKPLMSLAAAAGVALVVSSAYAATWQQCQPSCTQNAQVVANQARASFAARQTNYCDSLTDAAAKSACLAGVPAYADQQSQNVNTRAYNACMRDCTSV